MSTRFPIDRRSMLIGSGIFLTTVASGRFAIAQQDDEKEIQLLTQDPRNGGPALEDLVESWITPNKYFYVRSHAPNPKIDPNRFELQIDGLVEQPMTFTLQQLKDMKKSSVIATLTCAGNRRTEFNETKKVGGVQWGSNAIGNAEWTGVNLVDILKRVRPRKEARHICFESLDQIEQGESTIPFGASVPIQKVVNDQQRIGTLLAYEMNGEPLPIDHGFPLRGVVPGYIGARSVKWLGKITLSDQPSDNHYMTTAYKIIRDTAELDWQEAGPIYRFPINAAVAVDGNLELQPGEATIRGYVLPSGVPEARVKSVQASVDGGRTWKDARLKGEAREFCWQTWEANVQVTSSTKEVLVRAIDTSGAFMPQAVEWNAKGYLQNAWYRQPVSIK